MNTHLLKVLLIIVLGLLAYANSFQGSFHFDDTPHIVENLTIRDLENLPNILSGPRGLVIATFALNYAIGGLGVFSYHLTNIFLHLMNALLIYGILVCTFRENQDGDAGWSIRIAFFAALIFAVHPLYTQAVHLIVQRLELMASSFYLLCILFFILAHRAETNPKKIIFYLAVIVSFLAGLKSKEIVVTVPAALLLYDFFFVSDKQAGSLLPRWPVHGILGLIGLWFGWKTLAIEGSQSTVAALANIGLIPQAGFAVKSVTSWEYFLTQTNVIVHYISLIIAPVHQNLDYDFPIARSLFATPVANEGTVLNFILLPPFVAIFLLGSLVVGAIVLARTDSHKAQVVSFCLLMYFIVLSPTSSFIPIVDVIYEHRAYLASVFIIVPLVMALDWLGGRIFKRKGKTVENRVVSALDHR